MKKVSVVCEWSEYRQAVEKLVHLVLKASSERFGLDVFEDKPLKIEIAIKNPPIPRKNLYYTVEKEITIHWIRSSEKDPLPDEYMKSLIELDYSTMVFGLLHELGHSVFPDLSDRFPELPESLFEGWATFFAWSLIPLVWKELGEDAWPIPHNYFDYEMKRKKKTMENPQLMEDYYIIAFFKIDEESGGRGISNITKGLIQGNASAIKELDRVLNLIKLNK